MLSQDTCTVHIQYIPRNMHTVFALLCFVVVIHWLIFPYPSCLLHWHCGNLTIALVPAKQPWWIWINISCEFIMKDCITTTKQSTTKPCAYSWDILYNGEDNMECHSGSGYQIFQVVSEMTSQSLSTHIAQPVVPCVMYGNLNIHCLLLM